MKTLLLISNNGSLSRAMYPNINEDFSVVDISKIPGSTDDWPKDTFDMAIIENAIEFIPMESIPESLDGLFDALRPGGEAVVFAYSLEWAAANILSRNNRVSSVAYNWIYGNMGQGHSSGFTLPALRAVVRSAGFLVRKATQIEVGVPVGDDHVGALQNMIVGLKPE